MHPQTLRGLSQPQQFHVHEPKKDQYGSLSDTLSLDVTVVLLTPVVLAAAVRAGVRA